MKLEELADNREYAEICKTIKERENNRLIFIVKIIKTILAMLLATFSCSENCYLGAVEVQAHDDLRFPISDFPFEEFVIITKAAERNNCRGDDFIILLAIRKIENGRPGREFGILNQRCQAEIDESPDDSLNIQAGWAAATIVKNRHRWKTAGRPGKFIDFLADRYCPAAVDPQGNENWKINVRFFYERIMNEFFGLYQM